MTELLRQVLQSDFLSCVHFSHRPRCLPASGRRLVLQSQQIRGDHAAIRIRKFREPLLDVENGSCGHEPKLTWQAGASRGGIFAYQCYWDQLSRAIMEMENGGRVATPHLCPVSELDVRAGGRPEGPGMAGGAFAASSSVSARNIVLRSGRGVPVECVIDTRSGAA